MDAGGVASPEQGQALLRDGSAVLVQLADDWRFVKQPVGADGNGTTLAAGHVTNCKGPASSSTTPAGVAFRALRPWYAAQPRGALRLRAVAVPRAQANPANLQADRRKYKPGVVSSTVGAKLRLVLNTVIGAPRPGAAGSNTTDPSSHAVVTLAYLASYEHM